VASLIYVYIGRRHIQKQHQLEEHNIYVEHM